MNDVRPYHGWIGASWPAPIGVRALTTTREGGPPESPDMNVALHGGGGFKAAAANRRWQPLRAPRLASRRPPDLAGAALAAE